MSREDRFLSQITMNLGCLSEVSDALSVKMMHFWYLFFCQFDYELAQRLPQELSSCRGKCHWEKCQAH